MTSRFDISSIERADQWWRTQFAADAASLGVYRILFATYFAFAGSLSYGWISEFPSALFMPHPLTFAALADGFPSQSALRALDIGTLASLVAVLVGLWTRISTVILLGLTFIGNSYRYSFGKIDHDILFQCVLLVMIPANWGRALSLDAHFARAPSAPTCPSLRGLAVIIAAGFATAGFPKAIAWLDFDFDTSGFLSWFYPGYHSLHRTKLLADWAANVRPLWLWEFADIGAVTVELGFCIAMFRRRWFLTWMTVAAVFHLANCLLLNIPFTTNAFCYLAFFPWRQFRSRVCLRLGAKELWCLLVLAVAVIVSRLASGYAAPIDGLTANAKLYASVAIWISVAVTLGWAAARGDTSDALES